MARKKTTKKATAKKAPAKKAKAVKKPDMESQWVEPAFDAEEVQEVEPGPEVEIESGVPVAPIRRSRGHNSRWAKVLEVLEVGESVRVGTPNQVSARRTAARVMAVGRRLPRRRFVSRTRALEDGTFELRLWRVEDTGDE